MLPTPPSIEDIIQGFQYQATFDIPGKNTNHRLTMGVLWETEVIDISIASGRQVNPADNISRSRITRLETLVQAIIQVDDWVCADDKDAQNHKELKGVLRSSLQKFSPVTIDYLWNLYDQMRVKQDQAFREAVDELKKSMRLEEGVILSDLTSGDPGGN